MTYDICLPSDIFSIITEYTNTQCFNLNDLCDILPTEYKKKCYRICLYHDNSFKYYTDLKYRQKIRSDVTYPQKQLCIYPDKCRYITDVSIFDNVNTLVLSGCYNIKDVSMIKNVSKLILPINFGKEDV